MSQTSSICDCAQEDEVDITANSLHPGGIVTNLFRNSNIMSGKIKHEIFLLLFQVEAIWAAMM